jgi:molecular chaperone GrpE
MTQEQTTMEQGVAQPADNDLRAQLDAARAEAAEQKDKWVRGLAEFANYRKRTEREWSEVRALAGAELLKNILPVLDDLERAFKAVPTELQGQAWVEGFRLIERKFAGILEEAGVTPIETIGKAFDPTLHESVAAEPSDQPHGTILEEYRKGYRMNDRVLRPAMVKIAQ